MFVATLGWIALRVVRQEILVSVNADKILEAQGYASFLMGLQFGQIEENITPDGSSGEEILMMPPGVVAVHLVAVVVGTVVPASPGMVYKLTAVCQIESNIAVTVARKLPPLNDDAIAARPLFLAQV